MESEERKVLLERADLGARLNELKAQDGWSDVAAHLGSLKRETKDDLTTCATEDVRELQSRYQTISDIETWVETSIRIGVDAKDRLR